MSELRSSKIYIIHSRRENSPSIDLKSIWTNNKNENARNAGMREHAFRSQPTWNVWRCQTEELHKTNHISKAATTTTTESNRMKCMRRCAGHIACNRSEATTAIIARQTLQDNETTIVQFVYEFLFRLCMSATLCASEMCRLQPLQTDIELQHAGRWWTGDWCCNNDESVQLLHLLAFSWFVIWPFCVVMLFSCIWYRAFYLSKRSRCRRDICFLRWNKYFHSSGVCVCVRAVVALRSRSNMWFATQKWLLPNICFHFPFCARIKNVCFCGSLPFLAVCDLRLYTFLIVIIIAVVISHCDAKHSLWFYFLVKIHRVLCVHARGQRFAMVFWFPTFTFSKLIFRLHFSSPSSHRLLSIFGLAFFYWSRRTNSETVKFT